MRIATDESYVDNNGNKVDRTEWHTVVVFQRQAESCQKYLTKGSLIFVEGSLQTRKWQDRQGQDRYSTEVKAQLVQFLDRKDVNSGMEDGNFGQSPQKSKSNKAHDVNGGVADFDRAFGGNSEMDKVPF
jgi:single-strand DNA-binding protein